MEKQNQIIEYYLGGHLIYRQKPNRILSDLEIHNELFHTCIDALADDNNLTPLQKLHHIANVGVAYETWNIGQNRDLSNHRILQSLVSRDVLNLM